MGRIITIIASLAHMAFSEFLIFYTGFSHPENKDSLLRPLCAEIELCALIEKAGSLRQGT